MTHEPECPYDSNVQWSAPCICADLRAAYRRAREDAEEALLWYLMDVKAFNSAAIDEATAAARGDGEQA